MKFIRAGYHNKKRLAKTWRKPRGWSSKKRQRLHGHKLVDPGFGSPKADRGKYKGHEIVRVTSITQVKTLKKNQVALVGKLGSRKRIEILKALIESKIPILNIKNPVEYLKLLLEKREKKKEEKQEKEESEKKAVEKKESIEDKLSEEEKKKLEKKEIDRLLTKKF